MYSIISPWKLYSRNIACYCFCFSVKGSRLRMILSSHSMKSPPSRLRVLLSCICFVTWVKLYLHLICFIKYWWSHEPWLLQIRFVKCVASVCWCFLAGGWLQMLYFRNNSIFFLERCGLLSLLDNTALFHNTKYSNLSFLVLSNLNLKQSIQSIKSDNFLSRFKLQFFQSLNLST